MKLIKLTFILLCICNFAFANKFTTDDVEPSFKYAGKAFDKTTWAKSESVLKNSADEKITQRTYSSPDKLLNVILTIKEYHKFNVVEWLCEFENVGNTDTKIVSDLKNVDWQWRLANNTKIAFVRGLTGGDIKTQEFKPVFAEIGNHHKKTFELINDRGRSSCKYLPFFSVDYDAFNGFLAGIGWTGNWEVKVNAPTKKSNKFHLQAGLLKTNFKLYPKEKIRTPAIFIANRINTNIEDAQNLHRKFMLKHHSPHNSKGELIKTPYSYAFHGCLPQWKILKALDLAKANNVPVDLCWIDAGWYGDDVQHPESLLEFDWWSIAGDWRVNRKLFPEGLKKITNKAHSLGMNAMVWFESERVGPKTKLYKSNPENYISEGRVHLINMGDDKLRKQLEDSIIAVMNEENIDYMRNDFNLNPSKVWERMEKPDRVGIPEIKYITGIYKFWDKLRSNNPNAIVDNCASGGRRLDFETANRSIAMWRSDIPCHYGQDWDDANQLATIYLSQWFPLHSTGVMSLHNDVYSHLSGLATGIVFDFNNNHLSGNVLKKHGELLRKLRRISELFYHDIYQLSEAPENFRNWFAYQLNNPEQKCGVIVALRRKYSSEPEQTFYLKKINENANYEIEDWLGNKKVISGKELRKLEVVISKPRDFKVYFYKEL